MMLLDDNIVIIVSAAAAEPVAVNQSLCLNATHKKTIYDSADNARKYGNVEILNGEHVEF